MDLPFFRQKVEKLFGPDAPSNSVFVDLVRRLIRKKVRFRSGYSISEIDAISDRVDVPIPPDLREFWSVAVPEGGHWWNWSAAEFTKDDLHDMITEELGFHVESGDLWLHSWGRRPEALEEALEIVKSWVIQGPALLPVFAHRWALGEPDMPDTPVLSIHSSDWIYYGWNFASYLEHEFLSRNPHSEHPWPAHQSVGQWKEIIDCNMPDLPRPSWHH